MTNQNEKLTQQYSTWGDKLLQHTDVLYDAQFNRKFRPITIQLAPTEGCQSDCPFCSVSNRPISSYMSFAEIKKCLLEFRQLGAKSVEITGGGNPLLYKDKNTKQDINEIVTLARKIGYEDVGIITNSHSLSKIKKENYDDISWIRISLIMLDEGKSPEDYDFCDFPYEKLGFSYIIYSECASSPIRKRKYEGTSEVTIEKISKLVDLHDGKIKFVRFAGDCLVRGNNSLVRKSFSEVVAANDKYKKFFIKDIGDDDVPYDDACYVGMIRPYVAPHPNGGNYQIYTCTSHVLTKRTYDLNYSLGNASDPIEAWNRCNDRFVKTGKPYEINGNGGCGWLKTCEHCFYKNNNKLLHTVVSDMPDKNFP